MDSYCHVGSWWDERDDLIPSPNHGGREQRFASSSLSSYPSNRFAFPPSIAHLYYEGNIRTGSHWNTLRVKIIAANKGHLIICMDYGQTALVCRACSFSLALIQSRLTCALATTSANSFLLFRFTLFTIKLIQHSVL